MLCYGMRHHLKKCPVEKLVCSICIVSNGSNVAIQRSVISNVPLTPTTNISTNTDTDTTVRMPMLIQSNPAISNSIYSKFPLPRFPPLRYSNVPVTGSPSFMFSVIYYQLFRTLLYRIPRYIEFPALGRAFLV